MKHIFQFVVSAVCLAGSVAATMADVMVSNGDFEQDTGLFTVPPGYSGNGDPGFGSPGYAGNGNPASIAGWQGEGLQGINPSPFGVAPFNDNGNHPTAVAFLQVARGDSEPRPDH